MEQHPVALQDSQQLQSIESKLNRLEELISQLLPSKPVTEHEVLPERILGAKVAEMLGIQQSTLRQNWPHYSLKKAGHGPHGRNYYTKDSVLRHLRERMGTIKI